MKVIKKYTQENIEDLFLRACKSKYSMHKVEMVYRRFYSKQPIRYKMLANILSRLIDNRLTITIDRLELIDDIRPHKISLKQDNREVSDESYYEQVCLFFVNKITLAEIHQVKDYKIPAYWRNYEKYEALLSIKSN